MKLNEIRYGDVVSEVDNHIETAIATKPNLTSDEERVVKKYSADSFRINNVMHSVHSSGKLPLNHDSNKDDVNDAKILNHAIHTHLLTKPLTLFSGVSFDVADLWVVKKVNRSNSILITLPAFTSCSSSLSQAEQFSSDLTKTIHSAHTQHERMNDEDELDPRLATHDGKFSSVLMFEVDEGDPVLSVSGYSYSSSELEYLLPAGCMILIDPKPIHKQGVKKSILIWKCKIRFPADTYLETVITPNLNDRSNVLMNVDETRNDMTMFREELEKIDGKLSKENPRELYLGRIITLTTRLINKFHENSTKFNAKKAFLNCSIIFKYWFIYSLKEHIPSKIKQRIKELEGEFEVVNTDYTGMYKYNQFSNCVSYGEFMELIH